jgi:hypothetical protein
MMKMISNIKTLAALLMAGAAFTACSSDDNISEQPANPAGEKVYTLTVNATKDVSATTRALEFSGEKLVAKWKTSDEIYVIKLPSSPLGTLTPTNISADGQKATFTGTITTSGLNVGDNLILSYHFHDISAFKNQNGMLNGNALYSAEAYDQAEATVEVASIDGSNITTTADASFTTQTAMIKFTLQDNAATPNKINATSLNVKATITLPAPLSTTITEDLFTFTIAPEAYTYNGNGILYYALPSAATLAGPIATKLKADPYNLTTITESDVVTLLGSAKVTFTASDGVNTYTVDKTGYPFAAGSYYTSALTMALAGSLAGKFSVSSTKKVYFSKGNLQATTTDLGATWTWAFAANQWDYIGNAAGNTSINGTGTVSANGTVDLFGWVGASSTWTGAAQYGISNSTATNNVDGYGNVADEPLKSDWGNVPGIGTGWRTLTGGDTDSGEWNYLFNTRGASKVADTENARYAKATVNSVAGVVLFPDSYTHPAGVTSPASINTANINYAANSWSGEDWTKMEKAGCVFLPAGGYRNGTTMDNVGTGGYYWTSTSTGSYAYRVFHTASRVTTSGSNYYRYFGYSVRLVHDAN